MIDKIFFYRVVAKDIVQFHGKYWQKEFQDSTNEFNNFFSLPIIKLREDFS